MQPISQTIQRTTSIGAASPRRSTDAAEKHAPGSERSRHRCWRCKDLGWLVAINRQGLQVTENGLGKLVRCPCKMSEDQARRQRYLASIDGLTPEERTLAFETIHVTRANNKAVSVVREALARGAGLITLAGPPGVGKTTLLACAVNAARSEGRTAVYATMTDILDYLRSAYAPDSRLSFDARWELLTTADVLAIDELDEPAATEWAREKFLRLIDERWRAIDSRVTVLATNARISQLPEKVLSRLRDGRAEVVEMHGRDMRPLMQW